jgi:hypothetical protein
MAIYVRTPATNVRGRWSAKRTAHGFVGRSVVSIETPSAVKLAGDP